MFVKATFGVISVLALCFAFQGMTFAAGENLFLNPSFEEGIANWHMDTATGTVADFTVNKDDAIDGEQSALVTIETAASWGSQFGQTIAVAGEKGKTYTFAVLVKGVGGPVDVTLQIERPADPWDRAARSDDLTIEEGEWTELYVTFTVEDDFPEGWFAYINYTQEAKSEYRADMYQLYEGEYVPYEMPTSVSASANSLITTWANIKAQD
jgi:hypothetical protein